MANVAEKVSVLVVVGVLAFVGLSYTITGDLVSNPVNWFEQITNPTYQANFKVHRVNSIIGQIEIRDVDVVERTLSVSPKSLRIGPVCVAGYFKGTTTAVLERPNGVTERLVNDPNLKLCRGDTTPYSETFPVKQTGTYTITIKIFDEKGNKVSKKTVNKYIKVR